MTFVNESVIESKHCKHCNTSFDITNKDLEFYEKVSPIFAGIKYLIPSPKLCPNCRQQRRLSFRNGRKLYKRKCDKTGKDIVSIYSPDKPYKVYDQETWWSDKWDALDYGKELNYYKNFFEQFDSLQKEVPFIGLSNINCENCEYNHGLKNSKDCYLCFGNVDLENMEYSSESGKSKDSLDLLWSYDINNSYEISNSDFMYNCMFCEMCSTCNECYFCIECTNCKNCFLCSNLNNKEYYFQNIQYTKEQYFEKVREFKKDNNYIKNGKLLLKEISLNKIHKYNNSFNLENSNGDYIYNVKDVSKSFNVVNVDTGIYLYECGRSKDIVDCSYVYDCDGKIYECIEAINSFNVSFSNDIDNSQYILYSNNLKNSSNCFGCVGLKNKSYCILNKQYTKDEYEELVPKIIEHMMKTGEWGEFFPSIMSHFGYNETVAMEYFPITGQPQGIAPTLENEVRRGASSGLPKGLFNWSTYEPPFPKTEKIISAIMLPDNISDIPDDILNWAIECEITKKPFKIIKQELEFYRKHNLPIPRRHPDQRHLDRMKLRNPRKLFDRKCDKCGVDMKTSYSPNRPEKVYCQTCYENEVY